MEKLNLKAGLRDKSHYLSELESWRGIAILLVFFFHIHGINYGVQPQEYSIAKSYIVSGNTGVTLFFVLSGFLLSLPWLESSMGARARPSTLNFYLARIFRISPLYLSIVLLAGLITAKPLAAIKAAVFIPIGMEMLPFSIVWWTLSTEIQFYLLLPIIFWVWDKSKLGRYILLAILLAWLFSYIKLVVITDVRAGHPYQYLLNKSIFGRLPSFLIGMTAAFIYLNQKKRPPSRFGQGKIRAIASCSIVLATWLLGITLQKAALLGDFQSESSWHIHHVYESFLWAVLILLSLLTIPYGKRLIMNRASAVIGKLSYSLYLIHVPVCWYIIFSANLSIEAGNNSVFTHIYFTTAISLIISLIASYITYRCIELPFLRRKVRLAVS